MGERFPKGVPEGAALGPGKCGFGQEIAENFSGRTYPARSPSSGAIIPSGFRLHKVQACHFWNLQKFLQTRKFFLPQAWISWAMSRNVTKFPAGSAKKATNRRK